MGIGYVLYEYLLFYEDGLGNGMWNFNCYQLLCVFDVVVWMQMGDVLLLLFEIDLLKGVVEVVMIFVVGVIVNGIVYVIGYCFIDLLVIL